MFIQVEPTDFFMYRVLLIFDPHRPDPEDQPVRQYLAEHDLEPRYQGTGDYQGRQCELMQFGGCYLGRHLESIARLQRQAVEVEALTSEVQRLLSAPAPGQAPLGQPPPETVAALVRQFHQESSLRIGEKGEVIVALDGQAVREAARRLAGGASAG